MKIWNLNVKRGADGSKHLDIQMHGVIDGGWYDEAGVDTAETIAELNQHRDAKTVRVGINSVGGAAFGGVAMYNALQDHPGEVTCVVEGLAASAASLVAMAGKTVMGKGAMLMIHPPAAMAMGNATDLRKTADVLDKIQDSLAGIYQSKTGKSLDEINGLIDDETWMTADEAVAAGFADETGDPMGGDGDSSTETADPDKGEDDNDEPQMTADGVVWAGVTFPAAKLPQQIVAMAKKPVVAVQAPGAAGTVANTITATAVQTPAPQPALPPPVLAIVPPPEPQPPITRAELALRSPELVAALLEEGRAAGAAAERARLQAIDELGLKGCVELIAAAKYGEKPMSAPELAVAAIKAGHQAGAELLASRRKESQALAGVVVGAPDQTQSSKEAQLLTAMVTGINSQRGGK